MSRSYPAFAELDAKGRRKLGVTFYGPGELDAFAWTPVTPLVFVIIFRLIGGKDEFEASFEWAEDGRLDRDADYLGEGLFDDATIRKPHARALIQVLSRAAGDPAERRVFSWKFWEPTASLDDTEKWFAEVTRDEQLPLSDNEAHSRVERAVTKAMDDIRRCAIPWFERKLESYRSVMKDSTARSM